MPDPSTFFSQTSLRLRSCSIHSFVRSSRCPQIPRIGASISLLLYTFMPGSPGPDAIFLHSLCWALQQQVATEQGPHSPPGSGCSPVSQENGDFLEPRDLEQEPDHPFPELLLYLKSLGSLSDFCPASTCLLSLSQPG